MVPVNAVGFDGGGGSAGGNMSRSQWRRRGRDIEHAADTGAAASRWLGSSESSNAGDGSVSGRRGRRNVEHAANGRDGGSGLRALLGLLRRWLAPFEDLQDLTTLLVKGSFQRHLEVWFGWRHGERRCGGRNG
jgi:hypothetical protein